MIQEIKLIPNEMMFYNSQNEFISLTEIPDDIQALINKLFDFCADFQTKEEIALNELINVGIETGEVKEEHISALAKEWRANEDVKVGTVRKYNNKVYIAVQAHRTQDDWMPVKAPALWTAYNKTSEGAEIQEFEQPTGARNAYNKGDKVSYNGKVYESLIDANTWLPATYPAGWKGVDSHA